MNKLIQFQRETEQNMDFEIYLETRHGYFVCLLAYLFICLWPGKPTVFLFPYPSFKAKLHP